MTKDKCPHVITDELSHKFANMGFVCACLIVSLHIPLTTTGWRWWISQLFTGVGIGNVAVPYFFITSGFFYAGHMYEDGWWWRECRKRLRSLLVPYLFWNLFAWVFMHGLSLVAAFLGVSVLGNLKPGISFGLNPLILPQLPYLWYVRCLLVFVICGPVFLLFTHRKRGAVGLLVLFFLLLLLPQWLGEREDWRESFVMNSWVRGALWFGCGVYFRWNPSRWKISGMSLPMRGWVLGFLSLAPWMILAALGKRAVPPLVMDFAHTLSIVLSLWALWELVPGSLWPQVITGCAFPIFLLHYFVNTLFHGLYGVLGVECFTQHSLLMYFVSIFLSISVSWGIALGLKRLPFINAVLFGGR